MLNLVITHLKLGHAGKGVVEISPKLETYLAMVVCWNCTLSFTVNCFKKKAEYNIIEDGFRDWVENWGVMLNCSPCFDTLFLTAHLGKREKKY